MTTKAFAILAGGGTGGHTYPAIALAQELVGRGHMPDEIHFVGGTRGPEGRIVADAGFSIDLLPGRGRQKSLLANVAVVAQTAVAVVRAIFIVRRRRPKVVVGFGGYASLPCVVAAWLWRVPRVVHEQDSVVGLANSYAVRLGARVAYSFPRGSASRDVVTGNPIRKEFQEFVRAPQSPPLVVIFGGALGAGTINNAALDLYDRWRARTDRAVVHVAGPRNYDDCRARVDAARRADDTLDYQLVAYEEHMDRLFARATLAVCRAGAGTVAELAAAALPAVLVPLPGAPGDHQSHNAADRQRAGAAITLPDEECTGERLDVLLGELLAAPARVDAMSEHAKRLAKPDAAARLADLVESVARG